MPNLLRAWLRKTFFAYEVEGGRFRIVPMEGLRGLAVLLVFFVHYDALFGIYLPRESWLYKVCDFFGTIGNCGVDLFFVMSGYLIYGALIRREVDYLKFAKRRVERIYPTFLAVFLVYLLLSLAFPEQNKIHGTAVRAGLYILANFLLLPGMFNIKPIITVAWSLSYEFFFYLTIPLLIWITRMRRWKPSQRLAAFVFLWLGFGFASLFLGQENRARMISFLAGIVLYELIALGNVRPRLTRLGEITTSLAVAGSFAFFYSVHRPRAVSDVNGFLSLFVLSVAFFFLSLYSFEFSGIFQKVFSWTPLRYLGNMSYSYYLIHGLTLEGVARVLRKAGLPFASPVFALGALIVGFAATWVTSSLLFFLVEKKYSLAPKATKDRPPKVDLRPATLEALKGASDSEVPEIAAENVSRKAPTIIANE